MTFIHDVGEIFKELYPTEIRTRALGFGSLCGRLGGMLGPQIFKIQKFISWLPGVIVAGFAVIAASLSFSLPETVGKPLLQSLEEAEVYYECSKCDKNDAEKFLKEEKTAPQ